MLRLELNEDHAIGIGVEALHSNIMEGALLQRCVVGTNRVATEVATVVVTAVVTVIAIAVIVAASDAKVTIETTATPNYKLQLLID